MVGGGAALLVAARPPAAGPAATPPAPAGIVERHAVDARVAFHAEPSREAPVVRSFPAGTALRTGRDPVAGGDEPFYPWVPEGEVAGYVAVADVADEAPTAARELALAEAALGATDLDPAVRHAERAVALDPSLRAGWDLLAAVHDARGDVARARDAYAARERLPARPAPPETPPAFPAPEVGERRHVAATSLRVRAKPSRAAAIVTELPLDTAVEVVERQGEFVRVTWDAPAVRVIVLGGPAAAPRPSEGAGWVAAAYLAPDPVRYEALVADATAAERRGDALAATRLLERAAVLALRGSRGGEELRALLHRLAEVATRAGQYEVAARAAVRAQPRQGETGGEGAVEFELFFGCAEEPPTDPSRCVAKVDTVGHCAPCGAEYHEPPADAWEAYGRLQEAVAHERERARHARAQEEVLRAALEARRAHPSGPWLRAVLQGDPELAEAGQRAFVFSSTFQVGECELLPGTPRILAGDFPWPDAGTIELWVPAEPYEATVWGVLAAADAQQALEAISAFAGARAEDPGPVEFLEDPLATVGVPGVSGPFLLCACGCFC